MSSTTESDSERKQRNCKRNAKEGWKRFKFPKSDVFEEIDFDLSSEGQEWYIEDTPPKKKKNTSCKEFKPYEVKTPLTPSKSHGEEINFHSSDDGISDYVTLQSLADKSFNETSVIKSYSCDNIMEEFVDLHLDSTCEIATLELHSEVTRGPQSENKKEKKITKKKAASSLLLESSNTSLLNSEVQQFCTNDGIIIILNENQTVYVYGVFTLSVLHGELEVFGHTLTKNSKDVNIYSPRGSSLLYLKNTTQSKLPVTNYLLSLNILDKADLCESCAVVLCRKLEEPNILFIEKHMSQQILPKSDTSNLPRVTFQPRGSYNYLSCGDTWNSIIDNISTATKMIICGGKGVGKTTFIRYAINRLLMEYKAIRVIDLDPGQSEFTVPGCISVVKVTRPVFGCNYSHLTDPEWSILSHISISYEPRKFIQSVQCLLDGCGSEQMPSLVNCMGYTHGMGVNILAAVISYLQPTDVLQICSKSFKKNYKYILNPDVVRKYAGLFVAYVPELNYNLHQIESMSDKRNGGWIAEPRQLREMCVLSYISRMVDFNSIFKAKTCLYKVNLSDVELTDSNGKCLNPAAVNAGLVGLCSLEQASYQIYRSLGWGIVRGVDLNVGYLIVLTSENRELLQSVTHLVSNGITLPPSIYMTPDEITGQVPYVVEGVLTSFALMPRRSTVSVKK